MSGATTSAVVRAINLDHPPHYVHWHFFVMSVPNIIVIVLMIAVFVAAILLPFPRRRSQV
jgi:hypothetical protein